MKTILSVVAALLMYCSQSQAQIYDTNGAYVQTCVGSGFSGYVDGVGQLTMFNNPRTIAADTFGNLYVGDAGNGVIRKVAPDSTVTTFVGGGSAWSGFGTNTNLGGLYDSWMAIDHSNALWYAHTDGGVFLVRVGSDGFVSRRGTNLTGMSVSCGICFDSRNNLYYTGNNKIYRVFTNGTLEVFAGSGNAGLAAIGILAARVRYPASSCLPIVCLKATSAPCTSAHPQLFARPARMARPGWWRGC